MTRVAQEAANEETLTDPIAMEVFANRLLAITEDMGHALIRASFSPNIKERKDCSVGLFDGDGRLIAQAAHMPLHLGSLLGGVEAVKATFAEADIREGDAFICNDPFLAGGTHLPDVTIVTPIFHDGRIVAYAANIGHHSDVGGRVPGSIASDSSSIFEEGLRLPVLRLVNAFELDRPLMRMICANSREPQERWYDFQAQIATNEGGRRGFLQLVESMGAASVDTAIEDLLFYTERRLAARIAELKSGTFSFETFLDDDGAGFQRVPLRVTVRRDGARLVVDFAGTGAQAGGALNVAFSALQATVYYSVKALLDPGLPPNDGMFKNIDIVVEPGTILSPQYPAATGSRAMTCNRAAGAIFGAFREILPRELVQASSNDSIPAYTLSGTSTKADGVYVYLETLGGGIGARADGDGMDGCHVHLSNSSNLPAEAMENEYALMLEEYALVPDSGGAGELRGGLGFARTIRALQDDTTLSCRSDGHVYAPEGVFGGRSGGNARLWLNRGTVEERALPSKVANIRLRKGDTLCIQTCGGGGYGDPKLRSVKALAADLRGGKVTLARAGADFGVQLVEAARRHNET